VKQFFLLLVSLFWSCSYAVAAPDKGGGGGSTSNPTSIVVPADKSATFKVSFLSSLPNQIQLTKIGTSQVVTFSNSTSDATKVVQSENLPQIWVITGHFKDNEDKDADPPWKPSPTKLWLDHDDRKVIGFEDTNLGKVQSSDYQYNSVVVTVDIK